MNEHLICPISHDLLDDPVTVPCCGNTFSRESLVDWFIAGNYIMSCPMCRTGLYGVNPIFIPKNIVIANIVDAVIAVDLLKKDMHIIDIHRKLKLKQRITKSKNNDRINRKKILKEYNLRSRIAKAVENYYKNDE